jgi:hypothetical protein
MDGTVRSADEIKRNLIRRVIHGQSQRSPEEMRSLLLDAIHRAHDIPDDHRQWLEINKKFEDAISTAWQRGSLIPDFAHSAGQQGIIWH